MNTPCRPSIALFLTALAFAGARPGASIAQNVDLGTDTQREAGRALYEQKCIHCHGPDGLPPEGANVLMRPAPRNFTSGIFKFRTTASGELPTDDDIRNSIREGMPYTAMPAWPRLSAQEVTNLMYYIKSLNDDFAGPFGEVESLDFPSPPGMSDETVARGREVYLANRCSDCHGNAGRGDGPSAPTLEDQWGFPVRAADLTKRWTFRGGSSREDIYRTFTTGLDGTPMPSFEIEPIEDRWALVDYVFSLSRDEAGYDTYVTATRVNSAIDAAPGAEVFDAAPPAYFPVVGQIVDPGREFHPAANGIEVRAIYSDDHIAVMLRWNDMSAETTGSNAPGLPAPRWDEPDADTSAAYSDAVAIQFPTARPEGTELPYFLFGDRRRSVDLWFADLAADEATHYVGSGSNDIAQVGAALDAVSSFEEGQWTVIFRRSRDEADRIEFTEGTFVPVAFSVWDGFTRERGSRRGITNWYYLYVDVAVKESPVAPMLGYGLITFLLGLVITFVVRKKSARD